MLGDVVAARADGVARRAVVAEHTGIRVEACELVCGARVRLQRGAVENIVRLVCGVARVSPYYHCGNLVMLADFHIQGRCRS
jgi:hypothetical protein